MGIINSKLQSLQPYNPDIETEKIHLDANESCFDLPWQLKQWLGDIVAKQSFNRYPDPFATKLCEAFGRYIVLDQKYITAGNGSDELISIIFSSFLKKGDKALILQPDFSMYKFYCAIAECEPIIINKQENLNFYADEIIKVANEQKVKMIIFSNPCNPTGQGIMSGDVMRIVKSVSCLVVIDEAYMEFWSESVLEFVPLASNLIVLKTCSKALGLAAIRLGFAVANEEITEYLRMAKSPYNVNSLTQAVGEAVLKQTDYLNNTLKDIIDLRDELFLILKDFERKNFKVFETHTNFLLVESIIAPQIYKALKQNDISIRLIEQKYLRISVGTQSENEKLIDALKNIMREVY
jgi:histidinol-phosphate aminotransferase